MPCRPPPEQQLSLDGEALLQNAQRAAAELRRVQELVAALFPRVDDDFAREHAASRDRVRRAKAEVAASSEPAWTHDPPPEVLRALTEWRDGLRRRHEELVDELCHARTLLVKLTRALSDLPEPVVDEVERQIALHLEHRRYDRDRAIATLNLRRPSLVADPTRHAELKKLNALVASLRAIPDERLLADRDCTEVRW